MCTGFSAGVLFEIMVNIDRVLMHEIRKFYLKKNEFECGKALEYDNGLGLGA